MQQLPIDEVMEDVLRAVRETGRCVLMAPPGAGKTTRVPLALREAVAGRIVMLEPRRLAARAAAERMAATIGEPVGATVGYRMRGAAKVSPETRIEVVTEGIFTRMIQSDPELSGVGAVIFDEFHERSLNADFGLALALDMRAALRPDLALLAMSATLDAEPLAALMADAPVVVARGRAFPVETRWLERPLRREARFAQSAADLVARAVTEAPGSALVFLPGEAEIRRVEGLLSGRLPADCTIRPLYGAMPFAAQRAAIAPCENGRKVVLATSIAETSLTIEDVRIVVDTGRARRSRFDPGSGMARLVTERVTKAEAEQRRGRAGRVAEGVCYRMWTQGEEGGMAGQAPAEIEIADLAAFALELALWGAPEGDLALLTPLNPGALAEARALLVSLEALDPSGRITPHGREIAALPLHPRLAHMLRIAGKAGARFAAILNERDLMRGPVDLGLRMRAVAQPAPPQHAAVERIRAEATRLARRLPDTPPLSLGEMAALAYPDRIGLRRPGTAARYVLSGGKGAVMADDDPMAGLRMIVVTDTDGDPREARIRQAAPLDEAELRGLFANRIAWHEVCGWDRRAGRVVARRQERFGALVLDDRAWPDAPASALVAGALDGVRALGLPWSAPARRFAARVRMMGPNFADFDEAALMDSVDDWLAPFLDGVRTEAQIRALDITEALRARLDWNQLSRLDREVPGHFVTPLGRRIPIDYAGEVPEVTARLQEFFGTTVHPVVGAARVPLKITLTSPAGRPVQVTTDLPGFWASSYADVRKDMRGRYPRHPWPEDPTEAAPTLRTTKRGG